MLFIFYLSLNLTDESLMKQTVNSILNLCKNHKNYDFANGEVKF